MSLILLDEEGKSVVIGDTGGGADMLASLTALFLMADVGQGIEAFGGLQGTLSVAENSQGADMVTQLLASLSISDIGQVMESLSMSGSLIVSDIGSGNDAVSVLTEILKTVADVAAGSDSVPVISVVIPISDTGQGVDLIGTLTAIIQMVDSAQGVDVAVAIGGDIPKKVTVIFTKRNPGIGFIGKKPDSLFN